MTEEIMTQVPELPWYTKVLMCCMNRNRINPGKIKLEDCDYFIVEHRRTLRILRPIQNSNEFYEIPNDRPESINENFISKWTKRPHSLNKCRCSFRQSVSKSSPEREKISAEINRIRTSLCEAEKSGHGIDEIERRLSANLNCLSEPITVETVKNQSDIYLDANKSENVANSSNVNELAAKNKIVKDLEKYIDVLLKEVLNDTMKFISDGEETMNKTRKICDKKRENNLKDSDNESLKDAFNISFVFLPDYQNDQVDIATNKEIAISTVEDGGHVNNSFIGTVQDPDCLDFDYRKPIDNNKNLGKVDCVDSGINSVETMEFPLESELSLEQSLMEIIDAKFGRVSTYNWENIDSQHNSIDKDNANTKENIDMTVSVKENDDINLITSLNKDDVDSEESMTDEVVNIEETGKNIGVLDSPITDRKFDGLKLELKNDSKVSTLNNESVKKLTSVTAFCEKLKLKLSKKDNNNFKASDYIINNEKSNLEREKSNKMEGVELEDYPATWKDCKDTNVNDNNPTDAKSPSPGDFVVYRRSRKPIIVFLHGFGSSAEVFQHQLQYFSSMGYSCVAPEMIGHGMSSAPDRLRDYHFDKLLNDVEVVLHHYAFQSGRKCVLVAHNYGCSFATALACKYENEIKQLVLISGGGPTALAPPAIEGAGQCCLRLVLSPLLVCGLRRDIFYSERGRQHPYCGPEMDDQWPPHMKYILNGMIWPEGDHIFYRRISTPTLLIHGLRDNKVSLVQECQMERTIQKAFLEVIPTAGHIPMTDTPEQVNHMIHCFIELWKRKRS